MGRFYTKGKNKTLIINYLLIFSFFLLATNLSAQSRGDLPNGAVTASGTYLVPSGVTGIMVEIWGGGGAGGYSGNNGQATGGGGGGAYAKAYMLYVTPGEMLTIKIGLGGSGSSSMSPGEDTYIKRGETLLILAKGGKGVVNNSVNGGLGGKDIECMGDLKYSGGNGGNGYGSSNTAASGGGGAGAGRNKNGAKGNDGGNNNNGGNGGSGADGGGSGGRGASTHYDLASNGSEYGGGGGGGKKGILAINPRTGGDGADGGMIITFICRNISFGILKTTSSITSVCQKTFGVTTNLTFTGTKVDLPAGIYTVSYTVNGNRYDIDNINVRSSGNTTSGTINNIPVPTNVAGNVTISIVSFENAAGCRDEIDNDQTIITINPLPTAEVTQDHDICQGTSTTITYTLTQGTGPWSVTYQLQSQPGTEKTLSNILMSSQTEIVTPTAVGDNFYIITKVQDSKCTNNNP